MSASRYKEALVRTGYLRQAGDRLEPAEGLATGYDGESLRLEPAFSDRGGLAIDAVYETVDGPMLMIKDAGPDAPDQGTVDLWAERAWNLGLAPLLWIVTPVDVRVYDTFRGLGPQTARSPVDVFALDVEAEMQRLDEACGRLSLDTGAFWRSSLAAGIDRKQRVDRVLLQEIAELERQLVLAGSQAADDAPVQEQERTLCQELVLCTLFASYLMARGLAQPLLPPDLPDDLSRIYADPALARHLFAWLHETFNGDVFPENVGRDVRSEHLALLKDFVDDASLLPRRRGQMRLFRFRFETIPIELISSVYEEFAQRAAGKLSRQQSLHYTPIELVHMALDPVFAGLDPGARVLDPTCGSGLFLVQALRRLVWKRCGDGARPRRVVREILYTQVYGIDINPAALRIAAFSLYLASLEIETPDDATTEPSRFLTLVDRTLFEADFRDPETQDRCRALGLRAIVGNVPWTHVPGGRTNRSGGARPRRSPDQVYLSAAIGIVGRAGRLAIYVKATPFFSRDPHALAARAGIIEGLDRLALINLSGLRSEDLFPGVRGPALLVCANCGQLPDAEHLLVGDLPWTSDFRRSGCITLTPADFKVAPKADVLAAPSYLKSIVLGTVRDARLMHRLEGAGPTLGGLLEGIGIYDWDYKKRAGQRRSSIVTRCGQGFQSQGAAQKPVADTIAVLPAIFPENYRPIRLDPSSFPSLSNLGVHDLLFQRSRSIYDAPLLLCPKTAHQLALVQGRYSAAVVESDASYSEGFYGISFRDHDVRLAWILCAIMNSAVSGFQFLFGAGGLGIERPAVEPADLRQLRIPSFAVDDGLAARARDALARAPTDRCAALDQLADDLYNLTASERTLVRDTVARARSSFLDTLEARQDDVEVPAFDQLATYAEAVCRTVNAVLRFEGSRHLAASIARPSKYADDPLAAFSMVRFSIATGRATRGLVPQQMADAEVQAVYGGLRDKLERETYAYLRERRAVRIYGTDTVIVVKPAQRRYWNVAAGMQDGDVILADHWTQAAQ